MNVGISASGCDQRGKMLLFAELLNTFAAAGEEKRNWGKQERR